MKKQRISGGAPNSAQHSAGFLNPLGNAIGLDGVILLAYVIAIPANEIVVPTMLMVYFGTGAMTEVESFEDIRKILVDRNGWTLLTAVNLMLFSLLHNPRADDVEMDRRRRSDAARMRCPGRS